MFTTATSPYTHRARLIYLYSVLVCMIIKTNRLPRIVDGEKLFISIHRVPEKHKTARGYRRTRRVYMLHVRCGLRTIPSYITYSLIIGMTLFHTRTGRLSSLLNDRFLIEVKYFKPRRLADLRRSSAYAGVSSQLIKGKKRSLPLIKNSK